MAAELKENLSVEATLIRDSKGIFDVHVDGKLVFSRYETKRFPTPGEVARLVKATQG